MRKFFYIIALIVIFLLNTSTIVMAEFSDKTDWVDKNYKFSEIKYVLVCDVDTSVFNKLEDNFVNQIQNEYKIIVVSKLKNVVLVNSDDVADMKIISKITAWETESEYVPEQVYYEGWERKRIRNKDGKEITRNQYKKSHTHFFGSREC